LVTVTRRLTTVGVGDGVGLGVALVAGVDGGVVALAAGRVGVLVPQAPVARRIVAADNATNSEARPWVLVC